MDQKVIIETTVKTAETEDGSDSNTATVSTGKDNRTAEAIIKLSPALDAGEAGDVADDGVDGLATDHGIEGTDIIGVSWGTSCRYGITVDTASANAITFDATPTPGGDAMPAEGTAVVVSVENDIIIGGDGDNVQALAIKCDYAAHVRFEESDGTVIHAVDITAGDVYTWLADSNVANPLTGNPWTKIVAINKAVTAASLEITILYDT